MALSVSRLTACTMSFGSLAGPDSPNQVAATRSCPLSFRVGMSGKFGIRFSVVTASGSTFPARDLLGRGGERDGPELDMAGNEIGHRGTRALVGNVAELVVLLLRQIFRDQKAVRPRAGRNVADRVLALAGIVDEILVGRHAQ